MHCIKHLLSQLNIGQQAVLAALTLMKSQRLYKPIAILLNHTDRGQGTSQPQKRCSALAIVRFLHANCSRKTRFGSFLVMNLPETIKAGELAELVGLTSRRLQQLLEERVLKTREERKRLQYENELQAGTFVREIYGSNPDSSHKAKEKIERELIDCYNWCADIRI